RDPDRPLGTHVYTALEVEKDGKNMRWSVVTMPGDAPAAAERPVHHGKKARQEREPEAPVQKASASAGDPLNRINIPHDAIERIWEMWTPGSCLIVSDQPISGETGTDTDFIILTH